MKKTKRIVASTLGLLLAFAALGGPLFPGVGPVVPYSQYRNGDDLVVTGLRVMSTQAYLPPGTIVAPKRGFTIPDRGLGYNWVRITNGCVQLTVGDLVPGPGQPNPYNPRNRVWFGERIPGSEFIVTGSKTSTTSSPYSIIAPPGS